MTRHPAMSCALAVGALLAACARAPVPVAGPPPPPAATVPPTDAAPSATAANAPDAPPAPAATERVPGGAAAAFDTAFYRDAARAGHTILAIDSGQSLIVATVRRAGPFARLGHDHVVASHRITGFVAPALHRADLAFRLDELDIDEPALRAAAGLAARQPDADAIAGTRHNMLGPVLQAAQYPEVRVRITRASPAANSAIVTVTLHGQIRSLTVPLHASGTDPLTADGSFPLRQTDFGITPYAVLGGALAVQDEISLRYRLMARRVSVPPRP